MNISDLLNNMQKIEEIFENAIKTQKVNIVSLLIPYIKNPKLVYKYAHEIVKGKVSNELEDIIAHDMWSSYWYAENVLKGPFPKGEDAITQNPEYSYWYAKKVLKKPFPKGENVIMLNTDYSYWYAKYVLKGPFPKGEDAIAKDVEYSYQYAKYVLKDRFKKGEKIIMGNKNYLKRYIRFLKRSNKLKEFFKDYPYIKKYL